MKKGVLFAILFVFMLMMLSLGNVMAADENASQDFEDMDSDARIDLAYECLEHNIGNLSTDSDDDEGITIEDCEKMTDEEKAFVLMATGACEEELIDSARGDELCWPKSSCNLKSTAQVVWALNSIGHETEAAEEWIIDQKEVPKDLIWYLQIDVTNQSMCDVRYQSETHNIEILEDKTIAPASDAGSCLSISENGYWLKIDPACYDDEFEIKCVESSITNLLFKEDDDGYSPIHVLDEVKSAVDNAITIQQIESYCLLGSDGCDYEGTLWATMALDILDYDVSGYIPYLITGEETNLNSFPLPFLYLLTGYGEYETEILSRQINSQYWQFENGRYFDTALALLPFQNEDSTEKSDAIEWLLSVQQEDGCWKGGNIRDNSFLLYSIWPRTHSLGSSDNYDNDGEASDNADCGSAGFFCMSGVNCEGALLSYDCNAPFKCCDTEPLPELCSEQANGELCATNQYCAVGTSRTMDDGLCCIGGTCKTYEEAKQTPTSEEATCIDNGGTCETFGCEKGSVQDAVLTCNGDDICCVAGDEKTSYAWIWILFILIVLIVIGIIYRDKIKKLIEDMQDGKKGSPKPAVRRGPGFPSQPGQPRPGMSRPGMSRPGQPRPGMSRPGQPRPGMSARPSVHGKPLPSQKQISSNPQMKRPVQPVQTKKSPQELDSVLKKLKEMSK